MTLLMITMTTMAIILTFNFCDNSFDTELLLSIETQDHNNSYIVTSQSFEMDEIVCIFCNVFTSNIFSGSQSQYNFLLGGGSKSLLRQVSVSRSEVLPIIPWFLSKQSNLAIKLIGRAETDGRRWHEGVHVRNFKYACALMIQNIMNMWSYIWELMVSKALTLGPPSL